MKTQLIFTEVAEKFIHVKTLAFSEDSIEKIIEAEMRGEYEKDKYNFLPSESQELHPTLNVDGVRFTYVQYDKERLAYSK